MFVYVNKFNDIKEVGYSTNPSLKEVYLDENADSFPFEGWSVAKICLFKIIAKEGYVVSLSPQNKSASALADNIDQLGKSTESNAESITDTQLGLADTFEAMEANQDAITVCEEAIVEIYELLVPEEE